MKIGRVSLSLASVAVLFIQLLLVSLIAVKYLYQRWTCPRVWVVAQGYDPVMPLRGRYIQAQLTVDGCQSTLPSAKQAQFPRDYSGAVAPGPYVMRQPQAVTFRVNLKVENNKLTAVRVVGEDSNAGEEASIAPGAPCDQVRLNAPVDFFISDAAKNPLPLRAGQDLWVEVTVPPKGPPRPLQLALKENGVWMPVGRE